MVRQCIVLINANCSCNDIDVESLCHYLNISYFLCIVTLITIKVTIPIVF